MGFVILVSGIFVICGLVSFSLGKSTKDKEYQPIHVNNQLDIRDLINKRCELERRIKEDREVSAEEIIVLNNEIERIKKILMEKGYLDIE